MEIQLTVRKLKAILETHALRQNSDAAISDTIKIVLNDSTDTHLGSDGISVYAKSVYSECNDIYLSLL
jgi:hypothetical protein